MRFSIILPTYNSMRWLSQSAGSILSQSFPDFELIILDSGSTDETVQWLQNLNDKRIKIYTTENRLSIEANWDRIKIIPKGEYFTIVGHDDILYPDFLQTIEKLINKHPDAGLYFTHYDYVDVDGKLIRKCRPMPEVVSDNDFLKGFLTGAYDSMGTGYVMRSSVYDSIGGISPKYPDLLFADYELWLRLAKNSFMAVAQEKGFEFRLHKSASGKSPDYRQHRGLELYVDFIINYSTGDKEKEKIVHECGHQLLLNYCQGFSNRLLRTPLKGRNNVSVDEFVAKTQTLAQKLGVSENYHPYKVPAIKLASIIDKNIALRKLFLVFKKIYERPILQ